MAASIITLAVALLLGASSGVDKGAATPAAEEGLEVTYGSTVKLMHDKTKHRLHSHDVPYGSGSGQQSVTGFPEVDDSNSYWIVRPTPDSSAKQGDAIETGSIIRLQHMRTRRWLHSHLHASPLSGNLEVVDHGVDAVLVADMTRLAREFFALPPEEKLQFDMSGGKKGGFIVSSHLQKGLFKFVEQRGITLPTTNFMHDYMVTKQTEEYVRWLTKLKDFVRQ